jgi:tetratricopeptide (TPR) repeat protein
MINHKEVEKYNDCFRLYKEGHFQLALQNAQKITNDEMRACLYIDIGNAIKKPSIIQEGITIFEETINNPKKGRRYSLGSLFYNLANGYIALYDIRKSRRKIIIPPNDEYLRTAKKYFRKSIASFKRGHDTLKSQVLVNYGNCLSNLGRFVEAAEAYKEAVDIDPINGMAAGNLGIELERATRISNKFRHEYFTLARKYLRNAIGPRMHLEYGSSDAKNAFTIAFKRLDRIIRLHKKRLKIPRQAIAKNRNKFVKKYLYYCIRKGLFLNAWVGDPNLTPAIIDDISFGPITTAVTDNRSVPELLRILNEIKESFAIARYIYYISLVSDNSKDEISKKTYYFPITKDELYGIYIGLCKSAYGRAFDILDKVARIANQYFHIGGRKDTFWNIYSEKCSIGKEHVITYMARPAVCQKNNLGLFALADICINHFESEESDYKIIDERRNRITHDYLVILKKRGNEQLIEKLTLKELQKETLKVLLLAKWATIYTVSAISIEENKIKHNLNITGNVVYQSSPGSKFVK